MNFLINFVFAFVYIVLVVVITVLFPHTQCYFYGDAMVVVLPHGFCSCLLVAKINPKQLLKFQELTVNIAFIHSPTFPPDIHSIIRDHSFIVECFSFHSKVVFWMQIWNAPYIRKASKVHNNKGHNIKLE